jgi:hypothetical protein
MKVVKPPSLAGARWLRLKKKQEGLELERQRLLSRQLKLQKEIDALAKTMQVLAQEIILQDQVRPWVSEVS